jgi:hypothetical protein
VEEEGRPGEQEMEYDEQPRAVIELHGAVQEEGLELMYKVNERDEAEDLVKMTEPAVLVGDEGLHGETAHGLHRLFPFSMPM